MCTYYAHILYILCTYSLHKSGICTFVCAPCALAANKQTSNTERAQAKWRRRRASKQENFVWMSRRKPRSYLPCWPHLPVLLQQTFFFCFLCCCLSAAFLLLLSDLRLRLSCFWSSPLSTRRSRWRSRRRSRRQDEDQDGDEHKDQDDTHLVIITEATLVILDLNLRRALLLYEDAAATAASLHQWIAWRWRLGQRRGARFFLVCGVVFFGISIKRRSRKI